MEIGAKLAGLKVRLQVQGYMDTRVPRRVNNVWLVYLFQSESCGIGFDPLVVVFHTRSFFLRGYILVLAGQMRLVEM